MPRPGYDDVVLVTGFPSLYARKMVEEVLGAEPRSLVYTVVMPKFQAAARAEMEAKGIEFLGPIEGDTDDYKWTHFRAPDGFVYELTYSTAHPSIAE